jgi:hypothetical protein
VCVVAIAASIANCFLWEWELAIWTYRCSRMERAQQAERILAARGLTLYRVSQEAARIFGRHSRFYVPQRLYGELADRSSLPTLEQMFAISHITNYRLSDWMAVFGFDPDLIPYLQLRIPARRTMPLVSSIYDTMAWIPWFEERKRPSPLPAVAPLGQLLMRGEPKRAGEVLSLNKRRFLYARVGEEDLYALPHFAPRSIVRADPERSGEFPRDSGTSKERPHFLVEHEHGWNCSRVVPLAKDRVLLHSAQHPHIQRELQLGTNGRILGLIDAEIRLLGRSRRAEARGTANVSEVPRSLSAPRQEENLGALLRTTRVKAGLSFREASAISRSIAAMLSDELYFAASSTLSDYEAATTPPRQIQKVLTLCVLYAIDFRRFVAVSGVPLEREGRDAMPDDLRCRQKPDREGNRGIASRMSEGGAAGFLGELLREWEEVPLFLRQSLDEITSLRNFSSQDVFWVGGSQAPKHPLLAGATLVAANRKIRKPAESSPDPLGDQRLFLVLKRDGSFLCGPCILRQGELMVHEIAGGSARGQRFRNGIDAEIVGEVTAVLRRIPSDATGSDE